MIKRVNRSKVLLDKDDLLILEMISCTPDINIGKLRLLMSMTPVTLLLHLKRLENFILIKRNGINPRIKNLFLSQNGFYFYGSIRPYFKQELENK
jgi:DNA-binding MarR family transcriptional regulator